jgi:hypothetical protein
MGVEVIRVGVVEGVERERVEEDDGGHCSGCRLPAVFSTCPCLGRRGRVVMIILRDPLLLAQPWGSAGHRFARGSGSGRYKQIRGSGGIIFYVIFGSDLNYVSARTELIYPCFTPADFTTI